MWKNDKTATVSDGSKVKMMRQGDEKTITLMRDGLSETQFNNKYGDEAHSKAKSIFEEKMKTEGELLNKNAMTFDKVKKYYDKAVETSKIKADFEEFLNGMISKLKC